MSIKRGPIPADRFTIVSNDWLRDPAISWKAKGLLVYIASHAPGYLLSTEQIITEGSESRVAVRSGLAELESAGYLKRVEVRGSDGRIAGTDYELTEPERPAGNGLSSAGKPPPGGDQAEQDVSAGQSRGRKPTSGDLSSKKTKKSSSEEGDADAPPTGEEIPADEETETAQTIVRAFIDFCAGQEIKLTRITIARYGRSIKALLDQGFDAKVIKHALNLMLQRGKVGNVALLDGFVVEVQTDRARPISGAPVSGPPAARGYQSAAEKADARREREQAIAKIADELAERMKADPRDIALNRQIRAKATEIYESGSTTCQPTGYSGDDKPLIVDAEWWTTTERREVTAGEPSGGS